MILERFPELLALPESEMVQLAEELYELCAPEGPELPDCVAEGLAQDIPPEIAQAQITEVGRRVAQVEAGEVTLVPGAEASAHIRRTMASGGTAS